MYGCIDVFVIKVECGRVECHEQRLLDVCATSRGLAHEGDEGTCLFFAESWLKYFGGDI